MVHTYDIYPSSSSTCIESDEIKRYWSTSWHASWQVKDKNHIKSGQNAEKTWTKSRQNLDKTKTKPG